MKSACGELSGDTIPLVSYGLSSSVGEEAPKEGKRGEESSQRRRHKGKGRVRRSGEREGGKEQWERRVRNQHGSDKTTGKESRIRGGGKVGL